MTKTYLVPDVSCAHCKATIEGALAPLPGVRSATVYVDAKRVDVDLDPQVTSDDDVRAAIEASGYAVAQ